MNEDVSVEIGAIPLEHARTLLHCVKNSLFCGLLWERANYENAVSLQALLTYRIAKAEKVAQFVEPA